MNFTTDNWTKQKYAELIDYLKSLADEKYRDFHKSLTPGATDVLGIRMPVLRTVGKEIAKGDTASYYACCGNDFYEESMLMGIVIGNDKTDANGLTELINSFLPRVNNWAVCDCFCTGLKRCKKYKEEMFDYIDKLLNSDNEWHIRVGLVLMLNYFVLPDYIDEVLRRCDAIHSTSYYVYMAQAWLVSVCYIKFKEKTLSYLHNSTLNTVTYNKAIQKIRESLRVSKEEKDYLNTLKK